VSKYFNTNIYITCSSGQLTKSGPPAGEPGKGLVTPHCKKILMKYCTGPQACAGFCEHGNEPSDSIKTGNLLTS